MKRIFTLLSTLLVLLGLSISAHALLIDRGGGMIYDTDLNITWLQDANYAMTSGFDADGQMTWDEAMSWANNLVYGGFNDWRLPNTLQPDLTCSGQIAGDSFGYNCTGSEMGHLYYTELGNTAGGPLTNTGPFINMQGNYWSGTEHALLPTILAWSFNFFNGVQDADSKDSNYYAWAVRDGDVAAVPEPVNSYTFTTIDFPGGEKNRARWINNTRQIVGQYVDATGGHGYLFSKGSFNPIDYPGAEDTRANGINDVGHIVGSFDDFDDDTGDHGYLFNGNNFTTIDFPGASFTQAFGINDAGQIVGNYNDSSGEHGFLLTKGNFRPIDFPGAQFTQVFGINNVRKIVGYYFDASGTHGFLLHRGSFRVIDIPGAIITEVFGINNRGQMVGTYFDTDGKTHGFVLSRSRRLSTIDFPNAEGTEALGINDAGKVVGTYIDGTGLHGFLAKPISDKHGQANDQGNDDERDDDKDDDKDDDN